jgi:hypothetical protein
MSTLSTVAAVCGMVQLDEGKCAGIFGCHSGFIFRVINLLTGTYGSLFSASGCTS